MVKPSSTPVRSTMVPPAEEKGEDGELPCRGVTTTGLGEAAAAAAAAATGLYRCWLRSRLRSRLRLWGTAVVSGEEYLCCCCCSSAAEGGWVRSRMRVGALALAGRVAWKLGVPPPPMAASAAARTRRRLCSSTERARPSVSSLRSTPTKTSSPSAPVEVPANVPVMVPAVPRTTRMGSAFGPTRTVRTASKVRGDDRSYSRLPSLAALGVFSRVTCRTLILFLGWTRSRSDGCWTRKAVLTSITDRSAMVRAR
mmetsp:Transcript_34619/g.101745  ORF Transcript_34619/g.101745 Transcript_34619/m.101745 type:complete len:254 (-) Transcript_34619:979-1740(-)